MSRIYEYNDNAYYGGDSMFSVDEYLDRTSRTQQTPNVIDVYTDVPLAHDFHHSNSGYAEKRDDHHKKKNFPVNHQRHAPEMHKKVHFSEHQKAVEVTKDGYRFIDEEKTIDVEADGFIQKRHKNFESYNTFKAN